MNSLNTLNNILNTRVATGGLCSNVTLDQYAFCLANTITAIVVGTIYGVIFLAALIFFLCWFCKRRTRLSKLHVPFDGNTTTMNDMVNGGAMVSGRI